MPKLALNPVWLAGILGLALALSAQQNPTSDPAMASQIRGELEFLASDALQGRGSGTHDELLAAVYLASELRQIGIAPAGDNGGYIQNVVTERRSRDGSTTPWKTRNVIGILPGRDPELKNQVILLSAHLDHLGVGRPVNGDSIYNGADDDASGCVAVLQLARALVLTSALSQSSGLASAQSSSQSSVPTQSLSQAQSPAPSSGVSPAQSLSAALSPALSQNNAQRPRRTVLFAFFGSEETGGQGDQYFLEHPPVPLSTIVANLEFEMIGRPDAAVKPDQLWLTGYERSNLGPELAQHGARLVADPHPNQHFFQRSDNYALARKGIIAHTVSSYGLHLDYHRPSDDISRIDFAHMEQAIESMVAPVTWLANSDFKPQWAPGKKP
ncbi:MAG TPA: M28 family peptidase [Candidatus Angelobacter sp.]